MFEQDNTRKLKVNFVKFSAQRILWVVYICLTVAGLAQ